MATGGSASGMGSGGMAAKIAAARIAMSSGVDMVIISGRLPHPLQRAHEGHGTLFVADKRARSRKAWLAGRLTVKGAITVDAGAAKALMGRASLLAAGATRVDGRFRRGDVVNIIDPDGEIIARGISEYDADDATRIMGLKTETQAEALGYAPRSALVHRTHMVLL